MTDKLYDKTGREIKINDVLKVFHFIGKRRKKHYMYKQIVGVVEYGTTKQRYFKVDHLTGSKECYNLKIDNTRLNNYEIVQGFGEGFNCFEDRPKTRFENDR
jgi:hypothetical protein